jgi:GTPase Era involved in 16S rRNA processing
MSANQSLILVDAPGLTAVATEAARALIDEALAAGALIGAVRDAEENTAAVEAQTRIKAVIKQIEGAHRAAKDPLVQLGRKLDQIKAGLLEELEREYARIGQCAAEFALAEKRRVDAERRLAQEGLEKLEREKAQALAAAPADLGAQEKIREDFSRRAAMELPLPSAPARAQGQRVREEWEITVVDLIQFARWALYNAPQCADITVRKTAVKEMLNGGMAAIPGLDCKKVPVAGVTLPKAQKAIDV